MSTSIGLEKRLAGLDDELAALIRTTPIWRERDALLRSVTGVGPVLATTLLAHLRRGVDQSYSLLLSRRNRTPVIVTPRITNRLWS